MTLEKSQEHQDQNWTILTLQFEGNFGTSSFSYQFMQIEFVGLMQEQTIKHFDRENYTCTLIQKV